MADNHPGSPQPVTLPVSATYARLEEAGRAAGRLLARGRARARRALAGTRGAGWAFFDQCLVSAGNFVAIFLFARYLDTDPFGRFMLAYTGLQLVTSLQSALVVQPHNVLAAGLGDTAFQRFTGALAVLQGMWCIGLSAALALGGAIVLALDYEAAGRVVIALAVVATPWMCQEFLRRIFYTRGDARAAAINDALTYGLQVFGALVLVQAAAKWSTAGSALSVLGLSSAAGVAAGCWQLKGYVRFEHWRDGVYRRTWREVWGFGKWLTAQNTLMWFGTHGHAWVVGVMLGAEQVGFYRAVTHLANIMNPLRQAAYGWLPSRGSLACQQGGPDALARWVRRTMIVLVVALVPFCILLVGFPGWVLSLAYGERYAHGHLALILALTTVAQCVTFMKFPFDLGLLALRATRRLFYVYLIPVVLLFTSGVALIHFLGIVGVPVSGLIINLALLAATWLAYREVLAGRLRAEAGA